MTDRRELILSRLHTVLLTLVGSGSGNVVSVVRNRGELASDERPAIELWDANEEFDADFAIKGRKRPSHGPSIMLLRPKIYVLLSTLDYEEIPTQIAAIRANILRSVLTDTEIKNLCEDIYVEAIATDLDRGLTQKGEMGILIVFQYVLRPTEL